MHWQSFEDRFAANLRALLAGGRDGPSRLVVACSGGLDSTVLLYLLHFRTEEVSAAITVAHFDHRMRPDSSNDAAWVRGLCRGWDLKFELGKAPEVPRNEAEARESRYAFLRRVVSRSGGGHIVTAHHADDQAETVLFRALRGSGIGGLRGIRARSSSGLLRPLLPFWRQEIEDYATGRGLRWREDPTNETLGPTRNRIRKMLLPQIERDIAPGARRNLVRLAKHAQETEAALGGVVRMAWTRVVRREDDTFILARQQLRGYDPAVATRILRRVLRRLGTVPGRIGTRSALQFITDAPTGRTMQLPGGVRIRTEFDQVRIELESHEEEDLSICIGSLQPGDTFTGRARIGGLELEVRAGVVPAEATSFSQHGDWTIEIPHAGTRFPLELRGRLPGDRIRTQGGTKSLKKLMIERRVPVSERPRRPVLQDASGTVLWVAGVATTPIPQATGSEHIFQLVISRAM